MGKIKQQRVAEQVKITLSELLLFTVNDPRIQGITLTDVTIDRELSHADIKVNALGDESRKDEVLAGLNSAQPFLRREMGRRLRLRKVPQFHFHWDHSLNQVLELDRLLDDLEIPADEADKTPENSSETGSDSSS